MKVTILSSEDEFTSPEEYFGTPEGRLKAQKKRVIRCPKCGSKNVHKLNEEFEDEDEYQCNRCGETWKISIDGIKY